MESLQLAYKNSLISYYRFGSGQQLAICFNGYGEDGLSFQFLAEYVGNQYTLLSVDLPFHGKTVWKDGLDFSKHDLEAIVHLVLKNYQINRQEKVQKLTLIGFSLGGRIALSLCQYMPDKTERMVLLAPDGLKVNFWYWLSTQTWIGNRIFLFTMKYPGWFFSLLKMLNILKLVNPSVYKFVDYYIGDEKARQLLYNRWTTLRKIKPKIRLIQSLIQVNKIKTKLLYGLHDRIIRSSVGERFQKGIENNCSVSIIHSGHQVLHEKHIAEILPALLL